MLFASRAELLHQAARARRRALPGRSRASRCARCRSPRPARRRSPPPRRAAAGIQRQAAGELALEHREASGRPRAARGSRRCTRSAGSRARAAPAPCARRPRPSRRRACGARCGRRSRSGSRAPPACATEISPGEGSLRLGVDVLRREQHGAAGEPPRDGVERREGRREDHVDSPRAAHQRQRSVRRSRAPRRRSCASSSWRRRSGGALSAPAPRRREASGPRRTRARRRRRSRGA